MAASPEKGRARVPESEPAPIIVKPVALHRRAQGTLWCDAECNVDAGIRRVAQVIHAVNVDYINILRVEPVAWPCAHEAERIAAIFETAITVIALGDAKPVFLSKIRLETVIGNAAVTVTTGTLRLHLSLIHISE